MSKYTTEVRFICEYESGLNESVGYNDVEDVLEKSWNKIFNSKWELFDESYRKTLCIKILRHYYLREICCESVGIWKMWLNQKMHDIIPYYNQLYESAMIEYQPFYDVDYTRKYVKDTTYNDNKKSDYTRTDNLSESENNSGKTVRTDNLVENESTDKTDRYSDTPQGGLTGIENNQYLTNARLTNDETQIKNTGTQTAENESDRIKNNTGTQKNNGIDTTESVGKDNYVESVTGKMNSGKSYSELLNEYRETFLNIDLLIINELSDLFFLLW